MSCDISIILDLNDDTVVFAESGCEVEIAIEPEVEINVQAFDWPPMLDGIIARVKELEDNPPPTIDIDDQVTEASPNAVKSSGIWAALQALWESVAQALGIVSQAASNAQQTATSAGEVAQQNSDRIDTLETLPVESFSESFELTAAKANTIQNCTSAIDVTVTIPLNATANKFLKLPVAFEQAGNGVVSIVGADGVTVPAANKTAGQGKMMVLYEKSLNVYGIAGGVE